MSAATATDGFRLDVDVHGVLALRFLTPGAREAAAVRRTFGRLVTPLDRSPDVVVRFVDRLPLGGLRFVEAGRSGFTDDGFVLLAHGGQSVRARLPMDRAGTTCELVCERDRRFLPVLLPFLRLAALARGYAPLHASAFELDGAGVIAAGWAHGGKTSALLAFAGHGARYVGDDLVLLRGDGGRMCGLPAPLELSAVQAAALPAARDRGARARLAMAHAARLVGDLEARLPHAAGGGAARELLRRVSPALLRRLAVTVTPEAAFAGGVPLEAEPQTLFLLMTHARSGVEVERADPAEVAGRVALSIRHELLGLHEQYLAYRYAFPARENALLEAADVLAESLVRGALARLRTFVVRHPSRVPPAALQAAMRPYCEAPCAITA